MWLVGTDTPQDARDYLTKTFEEENPGSTLVIEEQEWTGLVDKLTTSLSSNDSPDIVEMGNTQAAAFTSSGGGRRRLRAARRRAGAGRHHGLPQPRHRHRGGLREGRPALARRPRHRQPGRHPRHPRCIPAEIGVAADAWARGIRRRADLRGCAGRRAARAAAARRGKVRA
ncbi:extracellular solute-binding protein [Microbacterium lacticum]